MVFLYQMCYNNVFMVTIVNPVVNCFPFYLYSENIIFSSETAMPIVLFFGTKHTTSYGGPIPSLFSIMSKLALLDKIHFFSYN